MANTKCVFHLRGRQLARLIRPLTAQGWWKSPSQGRMWEWVSAGLFCHVEEIRWKRMDGQDMDKTEENLRRRGNIISKIWPTQRWCRYRASFPDSWFYYSLCSQQHKPWHGIIHFMYNKRTVRPAGLLFVDISLSVLLMEILVFLWVVAQAFKTIKLKPKDKWIIRFIRSW